MHAGAPVAFSRLPAAGVLDQRGAPVRGGEELRMGVGGEELRKGVSLASLVSRRRPEVVGDHGRASDWHVVAP